MGYPTDMTQPRKHIHLSKAEMIARLRSNAEPAAQRQTLTVLPQPAPHRSTLPAIPIRSSWTGPKQRLFIKTLAVTGSVEQSCARVGMSVSSAYRLRLRPDALAFRSAWSKAIRSCVNAVRDVAYDRAINGEQKLIIKNGEVKGRYHSFNDRMIMWVLNRYESVRDTRCDAAVETQFIADLAGLDDLPDEGEEAIVFEARGDVEKVD